MEDSTAFYDKQGPNQKRYAGSPGMAAASMVLGLIAAFLFFVFYLSIPLAATAIVLALLSRGNGSLHFRAKVSLAASVLAIAGSLLATGYAIVTVRNDPLLRRELELMLDYFSDYYDSGQDYRLPDIFYKDGERSDDQKDRDAPSREDGDDSLFPFDREELSPHDEQYILYERNLPDLSQHLKEV